MDFLIDISKVIFLCIGIQYGLSYIGNVWQGHSFHVYKMLLLSVVWTGFIYLQWMM